MRVKAYRREAFDSVRNITHIAVQDFTESQAAEIGAVLTDCGLSTIAAAKLCDKWEKAGSRGDITYKFTIVG